MKTKENKKYVMTATIGGHKYVNISDLLVFLYEENDRDSTVSIKDLIESLKDLNYEKED